MKKFLFLIFLLVINFSCSRQPEKVVEKFMYNVKMYNMEEAKKYVDNKEIIDGFDFEFRNETQKLFFVSLFKNLEYEVLSKTIREDKTYVVNVKITNVDVEKIFKITYKKILKKAFSGNLDIKLEDEFNEILTSDNVPYKTYISQFLITKVGNENKILLRKENIDNIFGSYFSTISNINLGE